MLADYMSIGGVEAFNLVRLQAYLDNVGSPFTTGSTVCGCTTLNRVMLEDEPSSPVYDTPATDPAPWFDAAIPESADFLGFLPLSVVGIDDNPRARNVTNAVGGGGVFGPSRALPRSITVTGLLIGASCCGSDYGLYWLAEALAGCTGDACDGDCAEFFNCCPDTTMTRAAFVAAHRRTFRRTALVSGPTVTARVGSGSGCAKGTCGAKGDIIQVEFVLTAATPWPWTDPTELLDVGLPIDTSDTCLEWCLRNGSAPDQCPQSDCSFAPCDDAADRCADPRTPVPKPPKPTVPDAAFCIPVGEVRQCYTVDVSARPEWSSDVPIVTVTAGSAELRNVRISMYERPNGTTQTCDEIAEASRCNPLNEWFITYIPVGGSVTIDGQIGQATAECFGDCRTASTVFGDSDGGPVKVHELTCAMYCLCISTDPQYPPAASARLTFSVSGRGY